MKKQRRHKWQMSRHARRWLMDAYLERDMIRQWDRDGRSMAFALADVKVAWRELWANTGIYDMLIELTLWLDKKLRQVFPEI